MPADVTAPARRGPGRPPDLAKRRAIIDATLALLAEVGYSALTLDAVAQRAGSNRVLIYRVWDSKPALVRDALFGTADDLVVPDSGSLAGDLHGFVAQLVASMSRPAYVNAIQGLMVELLADGSGFRDAYRRYVKPTDDAFATILERARSRGELAEAPDPRLLTHVVSGITTSLAQGLRLRPDAITDVVTRSILGGLLAPVD